LKRYEEWINKDYEKAFKALIRNGKPIFYYPQHDKSFVSLLIPKADRRDYEKFSSSIKQYRNFYMHNPGVDIIQKSNKLFVIAREAICESAIWSNLKLLLAKEPNKFVNPIDEVNQDLELCLSHLRKLWNHFDKKMIIIQQHKDYSGICYGVKRMPN
jgi:hypothetical protein